MFVIAVELYYRKQTHYLKYIYFINATMHLLYILMCVYGT